MNKTEDRFGIASGGNWIVDRVKVVDCLPGRGMLANIQAETFSTGGAPANVLDNLSRLGTQFPLSGFGLIGDEEDGRLIRNTFDRPGIDMSGVVTTKESPTSFTDVMTEKSSGDRSFFHHRGANALFGPEYVPIEELSCKIFHLGYLLLLDRMDEPDDEYGTIAARFLHQLQKLGIKTSLDVVSEASQRFKKIVPPSLKYVDYLIFNEVEATRTVGLKARRENGDLDAEALVSAVDQLLEMGNMELVAVHMPEGVYLKDRKNIICCYGSLDVPENFIKGALGAGDAFCAGMLYGIHEEWNYEKSIELANCCATACLSAPGATEGVKSIPEVLGLAGKFSLKPAPVKI